MSSGRAWIGTASIVVVVAALAAACDGGAATRSSASRRGSLPLEVATPTPVESPTAEPSPRARRLIDAYTTQVCRGWRAWVETVRRSAGRLKRADNVRNLPDAKAVVVGFVQQAMAATHQFANYLRGTAPPRVADLPGAHLVLVSGMDQAQGELAVRVGRAYALSTSDVLSFRSAAKDIVQSVARRMSRITALFAVTYATPAVTASLDRVAACAPLHGDLSVDDKSKA